jgi:lipoate-protein ligase B
MGLRHAVITSVTRDDLEDGGAEHWASTVRAVRAMNPSVSVELLIPDMDGRSELINIILAAGPQIVGHNIETVERLTPAVRSRAKYDLSLGVLRHIARSGVIAKSGIMLGLGESDDEVLRTLSDLRDAGVRVVTLGQYLRPTLEHLPVERYVAPEQFDSLRTRALEMGFDYVAAGPLVRSSYKAHEALEAVRTKNVAYRDLGLIEYSAALEVQHSYFDPSVAAKAAGRQAEMCILVCEHPHVYTLGRNGQPGNILAGEEYLKSIGASVHRTLRGGDVTYHGPGQIVLYPIVDLERLGMGLREYIHALEEAVIRTLARSGIAAERSEGATGVWLENPPRKICAIGVRCSRGVTMHGLALNVNTGLSWFQNINPCGFTDRGVTSMERETGAPQNMDAVKEALRAHIEEIMNIKTYNYADSKEMGCQAPG